VEVEVGGATLELVKGDITEQDTQAIVNAANPSLMGGGGVDGAIHRAGGPAIIEQCRTLGGCPTGDAKLTTGGRLAAEFVIHAVGPVYRREGAVRASELLASAYRRSLEVAVAHGVKTIAFPSLSTGAYGYPLEEAAPVALREVIGFLSSRERSGLTLVRFVLFGSHSYRVYEQALEVLIQDWMDARGVLEEDGPR
jgi:O-acetyl-ADP-ribose deacetylase (regulator of RNase III)